MRPKPLNPFAPGLAVLGAAGALVALVACGNDTFFAASDASPGDSGDASPLEASAVDGASDGGPDAPNVMCASNHGPAMVAIGSAGCIDSTEVTSTQYAAFLLAVGIPGQPAECMWNVSLVPDNTGACLGAYDPVAKPDNPVSCVDWCDAHAYCAWAGKRLCGAIGGGPSDFTATPSTTSAWASACTGGGAHANPYGDSFAPGACNSPNLMTGATAPVGSYDKCVGGYPGLFDMAGNVGEWEDACRTNDGGATDLCRARGDSFSFSAGSGVTLDECKNLDSDLRSKSYKDLGFRCCSP